MSTQALSRLTCGICHDENLQEVGELDSCNHSFCIKCILQWSKIESRCPFCKARFTKVTHKQLELVAADSEIVSEKFIGAILEEHIIPERNQRAPEEGLIWENDPMDDVFCEGCGEGDHEDQIVLCDGCDNGWHTYCTGLEEVPAGEWLCPHCITEGHFAAERARRRAARRAAVERRSGTENVQRFRQLGQPLTTLRHFSGSLTRAMLATHAGTAVPPAVRATGGRGGGRRARMNRAQRGRQRALDSEDGDDSDDGVIVVDETEEEASEEGSPERLPQRTRPAPRRSRRRRRGEDDDPDDVDFRETMPGQRLPTPRRARRRTRSNSQAPRQAGWGPRRIRSTNEVHAPVAAQVAAALLLPTRAHRNVEELRTSWEAIRQGQADFGGPAPEPPAANKEAGQEAEEDSSEDSGDSDVPLSERFSAVQRARAVMERARRVRAVNYARRTQQPQSREQRRQAAFGSFSAARAEQQWRNLQSVASRSPQQSRQASGRAVQNIRQGRRPSAPATAQPSRSTILAQHLLDDERPGPAHAQATARQQELQPSSLQRQAATPNIVLRNGSARPDARAVARSSPEKQKWGPEHRILGRPEPPAAERRSTDERERRRISATPLEPAAPAVGVSAADASLRRRESLEQVSAAAKARLAQAKPSIPASRALVDTLHEPAATARISSANRPEGALHKPEAELSTPSVAGRVQHPQQVPEMTAAAPHLRQLHTAGANPWDSYNPVGPSAGSHPAAVTPPWGALAASAGPYWQVYGAGATQPLPGMLQSSGWGCSGGPPPPWLSHHGGQPLVGMPSPPMPATASGSLPAVLASGPVKSEAQQSSLPGSSGAIAPWLWEEERGEAERPPLPPRESRGSRAGASAEGSARAPGGSRLSERRSGTGSETSGNSSPGKFEPGHRSEHGKEEEFVRLKEKKNSAHRAVKALLDPLYKKGQLTSEEYKQAARDATHRLYKGTSELNEAAWHTDAARAVKKALDRS